MKKILLGAALGLLGVFAQAQNGLEGLIVEKYYVTNAADATGSVGTLSEGSATWRFYVDMLPGYKFQMAYGDVNHTLLLQTTTGFFNNEDRGATSPTYTKTQARANTVMLDSWLSVGAGCAANFGVLKTEDDGVANVVNSNGLLANNDASAGIPLTTQDGLIAGTPFAVTFVGLTPTFLDATSQEGNTVTTNDGAWACLDGAVGPTTTNRVLIAQITTDGVLHYELNIQIGTPSGGVEKYVVSNPLADELTIAGLSGNLSAGNARPSVSIAAPLDGTHVVTGDVVNISANATDADGSVVSVQFLVDGTPISTDATAPYAATYTSLAGNHVLTAIATDNAGATQTSEAVNISVGNDLPPTVSITAPAANSAFAIGVPVSITANATDDAGVVSVEFFVDGISLGTDLTAPYEATYTTVAGAHNLTAKATDTRSQVGNSSVVAITANNIAPVVSITSPVNGSNVTLNNIITIEVSASDADGSIASVEIRADGVLLATDNTVPYTADWTPDNEGPAAIVATAIDEDGGSRTATNNVIVIDANVSYMISNVVQTCLPSSVCIPVVSTNAALQNVIGYDIVMHYDASKVMPTGAITVSDDLIDHSLTSYSTNIDTLNDLMYIALYLGGNATDATNFHGAGQLFCAEFNKTVNFASVDTAMFTISSLEESYAASPIISKIVSPGIFTTYKDSTFHGSLAFWSDASPIRYNESNPSQYLISNIYGCAMTTDAVQPDVNGDFEYNIWNGTSIRIERDILNTTYVHPIIMAADAYFASLVTVKSSLLTPSIYEILAMDVNLDGKVSAGDVSQINIRSAQLAYGQFRQVWNPTNTLPSKDWLFVNPTTLAGSAYQISTTYPESDGIGYSKYSVPVVDFCQSVPVLDYSNCPLITGAVYTGIMLGDIDATYATHPADGLLKSAKIETSNDQIIIDLSKAIRKDGKTIIPVSISSALEVHAIDFAVVVNSNKVEDMDANSPENNPNQLSGLNSGYVAETSRLDVACYNTIGAIPTTKSFTLSVTTKGADKLRTSDFTSVLAKLTGPVVGTTIDANLKVVESPTSTNEIIGDLVRIYPNPATEILNVSVPENSRVEIYQLNGSQVIMETSIEANETMAIDINDLATGVYVVKVSNENYVRMQKVIVNK